jgi:hypothetical protein
MLKNNKMPNKRKICTENLNTNQSIYIASLNSYYPPESVINSAYRKVLDFKENAEKILEKEKSETLCLNEFSKAILDSRSFEISLQHNCIKLKCYITLEKDKDAKKKRNEQLQQQQQSTHQTPPNTPPSTQNDPMMFDSSYTTTNKMSNSSTSGSISNVSTSGGAKKVNVEVIMKSNPFRVEENEKTTRMELIRSNSDNNMLRFTYFVRPECEAKKFRDTSGEFFDKGRLVVFTNDFFTVYQDSASGEMNISLNEIVQTAEEQKRTEALGEKLFSLLKDRPRHRALLTNECKLNHALASNYINPVDHNNGAATPIIALTPPPSQTQILPLSTQEDETYYTRELIHIYGQPIVPSFHKHFNYQLSNTHYGYRTLRRLLNCDILKTYVKITKEEIKSLDRVVEFVQLTTEKCLSAFQLNITTFYDPNRFENGIVKNWLDVWYVDRLKEKYSSSSITDINNNQNVNNNVNISSSSWSNFNPNSTNFFAASSKSSSNSCFLHTSNCCSNDDSGIINDEMTTLMDSECDQANHLWFCLKDYQCTKMEQFLSKLSDYISIRNNKSELILVHTAHPVFEYKDVLTETRRILAMFLNKSTINKTIDEIILKKFPFVARQHIENLLIKFLTFDSDKKVCGFTALFEILMILKRELNKEKNDEMKYSHFLCTLERANQEKLKLAIIQLKCVPCLNKFTTNFNLLNSSQSNSSSCTLNNSQSSSSASSSFSHANMSRLLKQMSLIVSTELQQIAIDLIERMDDDKPVKFIKLKEEFRLHNNNNCNTNTNSSNNSSMQMQSAQSSSSGSSNQQSANSLLMKQQQQINNLMQMKNLAANFAKKVDLSSNNNSSSGPSANSTTKPQPIPQIFNPHNNLQQFISHEQKVQDFSSIFGQAIDRTNNQMIYSDRY